jgi:hypothetical protein
MLLEPNGPGKSPIDPSFQANLLDTIGKDHPVFRDLYDIEKHDRKKTAGDKLPIVDPSILRPG